jgi:hypothetical protein
MYNRGKWQTLISWLNTFIFLYKEILPLLRIAEICWILLKSLCQSGNPRWAFAFPNLTGLEPHEQTMCVAWSFALSPWLFFFSPERLLYYCCYCSSPCCHGTMPPSSLHTIMIGTIALGKGQANCKAFITDV